MNGADAVNTRYEQDGYLIDLAERLRARGLPADRVEATVEELAAHLEESGADPLEEFGPADEFAGQLVPATGERAPTAPAAHGETWRWTADTYVDEELLNRFGDATPVLQRPVESGARLVLHSATKYLGGHG
ncbi:PLP-dependent transferase, partial [Streptomyces sp. NPDC005904]|uniref:PLP-dependent transferase n=1 Tax=Streptomyces sp. NPDC005904 TaxID=3154570 RepID=UPI0033FF8FBE